jgi:hypothetical protein
MKMAERHVEWVGNGSLAHPVSLIMHVGILCPTPLLQAILSVHDQIPSHNLTKPFISELETTSGTRQTVCCEGPAPLSSPSVNQASACTQLLGLIFTERLKQMKHMVLLPVMLNQITAESAHMSPNLWDCAHTVQSTNMLFRVRSCYHQAKAQNGHGSSVSSGLVPQTKVLPNTYSCIPQDEQNLGPLQTLTYQQSPCSDFWTVRINEKFRGSDVKDWQWGPFFWR